MTTTNGWPGKPGVPMHPERDGRHWVSLLGSGHPQIMEWFSDAMVWADDWTVEACAKHLRYIGPVLTPDEATALQKRVAELEGALKDAATSVKEWGAYASQYLQDKWDLPGEVARYIAIAEGKNEAALEGKKDEPTMTEEQLREMMRDPRYWRQRNPEWVKRVTDGYRALVGGKDE